MNKLEFAAYCSEFSSDRDKAEVFDQHYNPDAVFEDPWTGTFKGKKAIVESWTTGHKGIHEVLKPLNVLIDGDWIAAEILIEWHCLENTYYIGPREKGRTYYVECAAFYNLKDGKFSRVKLYLMEKK